MEPSSDQLSGDAGRQPAEGDDRGGPARNLGLRPEVVVSDGSNLYPELLVQIWPQARHQVCVFHLLRALLDKMLAVVQRPRRVQGMALV